MTDTQKEDKSVPWEDFEMGDPATEAKKQKFPLIAEGLYEVLCTDLKMVLGKKFMSEETVKQFEWTFELVSNLAAPGEGLLDNEGNVLERTTFPVWSKLYQTKIVKRQPQLTRMIMCALLGLPMTSGLPGKVDPKMFIGKSCRAFVEIGLKQDEVTEKNVFKKFSVLGAKKEETTTQQTTDAQQSTEQPAA